MDTRIQSYADEISTLLETRMGIKGRSLDHQIHKSGRRLPRRIKRDAQSVSKAATLQQNPKLARMVDIARVSKAAENVVSHLTAIDRAEVMKDRIILTLAKIAAFCIVVFVALIWVAHARGMI